MLTAHYMRRHGGRAGISGPHLYRRNAK